VRKTKPIGSMTGKFNINIYESHDVKIL